MKIFVAILLASTCTLTTADISLKSGYTYNSNDNERQQQHLRHQQLQYSAQNVISNTFPEPSSQYLPLLQTESQHQHQHQHQQRQKQQPQQHQFGMKFPMPNDYPSSQQPVGHIKPSRRYQPPRSNIPKTPIVTKHFFLHSAPEETQAEIDEELAELQQQPRKHYNVLFVTTPSQTHTAAALSLAKTLREEKTIVYVLTRKTSAADLQDSLQESQQHNSKPEVFFIKYRTPEEAAEAQRQIRYQYDTLGGTTSVSDEGVAPVTSVIGTLGASKEGERQHAEEEEEEEDEEQQQRHLLDKSQEETQRGRENEEQQVMNRIALSNNNSYLPPENQY